MAFTTPSPDFDFDFTFAIALALAFAFADCGAWPCRLAVARINRAHGATGIVK